MPAPLDPAPPWSERLWQIIAPTMAELPLAAQSHPADPSLGPPGQRMEPYSQDRSEGPLSKNVPSMAGWVLAGGPAGAQTRVALQARSVFGHQPLPPVSGQPGLTVGSQGAAR